MPLTMPVTVNTLLLLPHSKWLL